MNNFVCFDTKHSHLKFVQAF